MNIRNPLTKDEVRGAMEALTAAGLPLSLRGVLERCGRGSLSTIARFKAEVLAEQAAHAAKAPTIDPALQPIFALDPKLYARLIDAARSEVRKETEALQVRAETLEADQAALVATTAALEEQVAQLTAQQADTAAALAAETARRDAIQTEYQQAAIRWTERMHEIGERLAAMDEVKQHLHAVAINQSRITVAVEALPAHIEQLTTQTTASIGQLSAEISAHQQAIANDQQEKFHELQITATRESNHIHAHMTNRLGQTERILHGLYHTLVRAFPTRPHNNQR